MSDSPDATDDEGPSADVEDAMLPESEVIENFETYIEALEAEIAMAESAIAAMQSGDLQTANLVEALPNPSPMDLWKTDRWRDRPHDYDPTQLNIPDYDADHE